MQPSKKRLKIDCWPPLPLLVWSWDGKRLFFIGTVSRDDWHRFFRIVTHLGPLIHMLQDFCIWSGFRGEIRGWKTNSAVSCHWYRGVNWVVSLTPRSQAHRCPHHTQSQNGDLLTDTRLQTAMLSLLSQFRDVNKTLVNDELSLFCHIIKIM